MNRRLALAIPLAAALALTACSGSDDSSDQYHGFDSEADYEDALETFACDLLDKAGGVADAYNTVVDTPELQDQYHLDATDLHDAIYSQNDYECSVDWVKAGTIQEIEDKGYFDHDYAVEKGVVD